MHTHTHTHTHRFCWIFKLEEMKWKVNLLQLQDLLKVINNFTGFPYFQSSLSHLHNKVKVIGATFFFNLQHCCVASWKALLHTCIIYHTPQTLHVLPHTSNAAYITTHLKRCMYFHTPQTLHVLPHTSNVACITTHLKRCMYYHTPQTLHVLLHTSNVACITHLDSLTIV